jgi:hypothetical protein
LNKERLLRLADLLEKNAEKGVVRFDMCSWASFSDPKKPVSCGTSVCALGLAALSGAFRKDGLGYIITRSGNMLFYWDGKETDGYTAAQKLFRIDWRLAYGLFEPRGNSAADVGKKAELRKAREIREVVRRG